MIRTFTVAVITAFAAIAAYGQTSWQWQHPHPLGHGLYAVGTIDDNRMVATTWLPGRVYFYRMQVRAVDPISGRSSPDGTADDTVTKKLILLR